MLVILFKGDSMSCLYRTGTVEKVDTGRLEGKVLDYYIMSVHHRVVLSMLMLSSVNLLCFVSVSSHNAREVGSCQII